MLILIFVVSLTIIGWTSVLTAILSKQSHLKGVFSLIAVITLFAGALVLPLGASYKITKTEITNYELTYGEGKVIIDMINSPEKDYERFYVFDRYNSVIEINDYTKFYMIKDKSLYGLCLDRYLVWSNPPYETFNKE